MGEKRQPAEAVMSRDIRRSFDITDQIKLLAPRPYLAIAGTKALTLRMHSGVQDASR